MEIGGHDRLFTAKHYEYEGGCQELGETVAEALNIYRLVDHPYLASVLCGQKPAHGKGPVILTEYIEGCSHD
jgi:hypothetical protein